MGAFHCKLANESLKAPTTEDEIDQLLNKYMSSRQPKNVARRESTALARKVKRRSRELAKKAAEEYVGSPIVPEERQVVRVRQLEDEDWVEVVCLTQKTRFAELN